MKIHVLALLVLACPVLACRVLVGPVRAQSSCESWIAELWETEGGEAMTAHACAPSATGRDALLFVQCDGPETYAIFYDDGGEGAPPGGDPDYAGVFTFTTEDVELTLNMTYQGLDGTYYVSMPKRQLENLFSSGPDVVVDPADEEIHGRNFVLLGSGTALEQILADCGG
jgi:hypothetical protein